MTEVASVGAEAVEPGKLAENVPEDWWKDLFNEMYLKTDGDVVEDPKITREEVDTFISLGLKKSDRILDLCCGQGRHTLELGSRGFSQITGYDYSQFLLDVANQRKLTNEATKHIPFVQGDARHLPFEDNSFDVVMMLGNSFGYFANTKDDILVLQEVTRVLSKDGTAIFDLTDGRYTAENYSPKSWEWIGNGMLVCRERELTDKCLISREIIIDSKTGVIKDQFYSERLFTPEEILEHLKEAGFATAEVVNNMKHDKDKHDDLGMMAQRMIVKASKEEDALLKITELSTEQEARLKALRFPFSKVTVIMGDPTIPSPEKLRGQWNPEDFATRDKLKAALKLIPGLQFTFLDNHNQLSERLKKQPQFVLNLCDEGYNNKPELELNIPAMLDAFSVPYSGSGPICLAKCYDKSLVRGVAESINIPVPKEVVLLPDHSLEEFFERKVLKKMTFPMFIKPNFGDGSTGICKDSYCENKEDAFKYINKLREQFPDGPVLIQEYLSGTEYSVGLIGNGKNMEAFPILYVDYSKLDPSLPPILGFESKWDPTSPYWTDLKYGLVKNPSPALQAMVDQSIRIVNRLGSRDYTRLDWRADANGVPKLMEVNPNPGWCWDGHLMIMAGMHGWSYPELLANIIYAAQIRTAFPIPE